MVAYLEVDGVNSQHERVQLAKAEESSLQVVDLADGIVHSTHDGDAMLPDGGRAGARVLPVREIGLGLGVHSHQPGESETTS